MKTLVKTVIILVIGIFCFACTPNLPDIPIYIHQSGWGTEYYSDDLVIEKMTRLSNGSFLYTGTWKEGKITLNERPFYELIDWNGKAYDFFTLDDSGISGESNLYWGEIVKYIYYPSSQSLEVVPTGATPTYYCYCDYIWTKMEPDKDGTFSCVAGFGNYDIYINTLPVKDGMYEAREYGSLRFSEYHNFYDKIKYTFNPKTKSLTTTKL